MRILNVVSILCANEGGGNAERTVQLTRAIISAGESCAVITLNIGDWQARREQLSKAKLVVLPCFNRRYNIPVPLWPIISEEVRQADIIHIVGFWSVLGAWIFLSAKIYGIPCVVSPTGALSIFGRSKSSKLIFNWIIGRRLVSKAAGWIAVTKSELPDFRKYGVPIEQVEIIPNGIVEADYLFSDEELLPFRGRLPSGPYILFMGRLNPIKGPDLLLEAFIRVHHEFPSISLVFAGPDQGMRVHLELRAKACDITDKVFFLGFVGGLEKVAAYRSAIISVVPSRSEAMSIVAVEAGICGIPVLITDQCGLSDLSEVNQCLVVSASEEGLAMGLRLALSDLTILKAWGIKWQLLVRERFLWKDMAARLIILFEGIINSKRSKT
jgi:glycosyltransferase involved in cell wall biosynthesis